jgi:hypothetical protein
LFALSGGCTAKPRCGPGATRLELRDGEGVLRMRVAESVRRGELDLCDAAGVRVGALGRQGETLVVYDRLNAERLRVLTVGALELDGPGGAALRLQRQDATIRVLASDGVPFGSILERDGVVYVSDPGGAPLAKISRRDADAVLAAADGKVIGFVVPSPGLVPAGFLALEALPLEQRALLAAHLGRGRLLP